MKLTQPESNIEARQLKELRETAGITQKDLGKELGLPQKDVEAFENGRKRASDELQLRWRRAVKRIIWARAVSVGAIPRPKVRPDFMLEETEVQVPDP